MPENITKRETNAYFTHMGVIDSGEASTLAKEHTWSIFEILRKAGAKGLTAKEVVDEIEQLEGVKPSESKIYALLKLLKEMRLLHRHYDKEKEAQAYTQISLAGQIEIDTDFFDDNKDKMGKFIERELFPVFQRFLEKTISELDSDKKTKDWLPDHGKHCYCVRCHINHEAEEFADCIINIASSLFMDSDSFIKFVKKNEFADKKYE